MIRKIASYACCVFSVVCIVITISLLTPQASAQTSCQTPSAVTGVAVVYPNCSGPNCDFNSATCSWTAAANAVTYTVLVTNASTGAQVKSETVSASTTSTTFPVTSGAVYKCDITGVNACGTAGPTGTHSLLCEVDQASNPSPTTPPVVNQPPPAQLPATGAISNSIMIATASILFITIGGYALKKR